MKKWEAKALEATDYRVFLGDYLPELRAACPMRSINWLSHRVFGNESLLTAVKSGRRILNPARRVRLVKELCLTPKAGEYFELLVQQNQARDPAGKKEFSEKLAALKPPPTRILGEDEREYYSKWYYLALSTYLTLPKTQSDPGRIGMEFIHNLSVEQVEDGLQLLRKLGLIYKLPAGMHRTRDEHVVSSLSAMDKRAAIEQFEQFSGLARTLMPNLKGDEATFQNIVLTLDSDGYKTLNESVTKLREKARQVSKSKNKISDRVYTLSIQLYPNTVKKPTVQQ